MSIVIPPDVLFEDAEFIPSPDLQEMMDNLIGKDPSLAFIDSFQVHVLWKQKGGASSGRPILGKCVKTSGALRFYSQQHFLIWLAADHVRQAEFDDHQIEALLFHEMLHIDEKETPEGETLPAIRGHDAELFTREIEEYGIWEPSMGPLAKAFKQLTLPIESA